MEEIIQNSNVEFSLAQITVICPMCENLFATQYIEKMDDISVNSKIEADLHRVIEDSSVRSALLAMCPACLHTWWFSSFKTHYYLPQMVVEAPDIKGSKKFAHAILCGRKMSVNSLDIAVLALNGWWQARENNEPDKTVWHWLELAIGEIEKALDNPNLDFNKSRYTFILAELLRQSKDFNKAISYFRKVDAKSLLPKELIDNQFALCVAKDYNPRFLSAKFIEDIFIPLSLRNTSYYSKVS